MLIVALTLLACGGTTSEPIPMPRPVEAATPAPPPAAPPHGAPAHGKPASLGVFQGVLGEQHVADGTRFLRLTGCDQAIWVATDAVDDWPANATLVTLGGAERTAVIPGVSGEPTVRFVDRIAPALQPLDCSVQGRSGYPHVGRVLQSHVAGGYVYAEVAYCDRVAWLAGPEAVLTKGRLVGHADGTPQRGFTSKALGRRFDEITFVPKLGELEGSTLPCEE